jgi:dUTP pyrophosphatase
MQLPPGYKAEVFARSGLASRGLVILNGPGQIDEDYRGRVCLLVGNVGKEIFVINHGDRLAQMCPTPVYKFTWERAEKLDESERGASGFGSTGVK